MIDTTQLTQQVNWLDEQHRRDRSELVALQQRVEAQNAQLLELSRKLQEVEGRLASTAAQLTRFSQVDQALAQLKEEVTLMLRREEEQRQLAEREAARIRLVERESVMKAINDMRQQLRAITKLQDELELRKAEEQRLSEAIMNLRHSLEDFARQAEAWSKNLAYLEEQRRQENKRSAQLQQESAELMKRTEALKGFFEVAEKSISRLETRLNTLWNARDEMKADFIRSQESLLLAEQERARQFASQTEQFEGFVRQMEEFGKEVQQFRDQFNENQRKLAQLTQLEERLKRDQAQVAELQRLAEERMRKEFEEFQAEDERRWRKHEVIWDNKWNEQARANVQFNERLVFLEERMKAQAKQIEELWQVHHALARLQSAEAEHWLSELTKFWDERTK